MSDETKAILSAILHKLETLDSKVDGLTDRVDSMQQEMSDMKQEMSDMKQEMNDMKQEMNARFNHVDRHLRLFDSDYELILQKLATHEKEINRLKPSS